MRAGFSFLPFVAMVFACGVSVAQMAVPPAASPDKQIHIAVQVNGSGNKPAAGLGPNDFTLLEDKQPQAITSLKVVQKNTIPTEVVIVVDAVNAPFTAVSYQRDQLEKYLRSNEGMLPYRTIIGVLTDKGFEVHPQSSTNGNELADSVAKYDLGLREIGRAQGFYGASDRMGISVNALQQLIAFEAKRPGRKLVLWLSPGWPILSGPNVELGRKEQDSIFQNIVTLSTLMRESNITLYSLDSWGAGESLDRSTYYNAFLDGVKKPGDTQLGNLSLQVLATQSGGLVLNTSDTAGMVRQCIADADLYYELSFEEKPDEHPQTYHQLQVKVADGGAHVRSTQGYYSQP